MRNTVEIRIQNADMAVHGRGYVISMLQSIHSVSYVLAGTCCSGERDSSQATIE